MNPRYVPSAQDERGWITAFAGMEDVGGVGGDDGVWAWVEGAGGSRAAPQGEVMEERFAPIQSFPSRGVREKLDSGFRRNDDDGKVSVEGEEVRGEREGTVSVLVERGWFGYGCCITIR